MAKKSVIKLPFKILKPIWNFLKREERRLLKRRKEISKEDPFVDTSRVVDNAAVDTDAAEQVGHARVSAMKKELDKRLIQIRKALSRIKLGKYAICEKCGKMIDTDRLMVKPEATTCVKCEREKEG